MVRIDKEKCIGCGACVSVCSDAFELINGKASIRFMKDKNKSCIKEAINNCPVNAISN